MKNNIKGFLFDLDGTFYVSNKIIKNANSTIEWLNRNRIRYMFITNTTTKSRLMLSKQLNDIGININKESILTANYAGTLFLKSKPNSTYELILNDAAKEEYDKSNSIILEEISVSARKIPMELSKTGSSVEIISRKDVWPVLFNPRLTLGLILIAINSSQLQQISIR